MHKKTPVGTKANNSSFKTIEDVKRQNKDSVEHPAAPKQSLASRVVMATKMG